MNRLPVISVLALLGSVVTVASLSIAKETPKNFTGATRLSANPLPVASNAGSGAACQSPLSSPPSVPAASRL